MATYDPPTFIHPVYGWDSGRSHFEPGIFESCNTHAVETYAGEMR